jgi:hypothetical protein
LRTGPLVRRGANVSRAGQAPAAIPRMLPRGFGKQNLSLAYLPLLPIAPKARARSTCRLPINLRGFLAAQLGCQPEASDDIILGFAARADQLTLNRIARAIRRYSTARAHEAWAECSLAVEAFVQAHQHGCLTVLCLRCVRVDFGHTAAAEHQRNGCVPITLARAEALELGAAAAEEVPQQIQRLVEEFRALRTAFGLPHFDLDCYVRGEQLTLMWRPLP